MVQDCISKVSCFMPSFVCHLLKSLGLSASPVLVRTWGQWLSHCSSPGVYASSASTSNRTSNSFPPLHGLQQFPAKILKISQVLHHIWQQAPAHLTDESEHYPCFTGGKADDKIQASYQKSELAATQPLQPGFPMQLREHGELEQNQSEITRTNTPLICIRKTLWKL